MSTPTLDERLRTILTITASDECIDKDYIDDKIAAIHAAVKEAGYTPHLSAYHNAYLEAIKKETGLLSGQEWLIRFEKQMPNCIPTGNEIDPLVVDWVMCAARRASGVDHE